MVQTETRSLQQIKRETEQARAGLTDTVEQLRASVAETAGDIRERIKPEAIKAEVSDYIKSRGEQLVNDVTAAARRNPMQAVAVGASIAYPVFRILRTVPVPVLMVGAGLFFAGSKRGQLATKKASVMAADLSDEVVRRAREFEGQVGESASAAKAYASDQLDRVSAVVAEGADQATRIASAAGATLASTTENLRDRAASLASSISARATDLKDNGVQMARAAAGSTQESAMNLTSSANSVAHDAADDAQGLAQMGLDAARSVRDKATELNDRVGKTFVQTVEQNPLLVAGVGLLVGGLIASALPRSNVEDGLAGGASAALKRRTRVAASHGFDAAKNAVEEAYGETTRPAKADGSRPPAFAPGV